MRVAIITGASSGLGEEFALQMGRYFTDIDQVWLIARRKEKLEALSSICIKCCFISTKFFYYFLNF